ncbi:transient-receptor-potential-like protein isoform X3 [Biomphalaria glabrata]|uniref:Transient-receptor-potential-like protein isoform X3 n=1 Tax=Biomphalaria glabrata TaxID=6526 RepID=A0A9W3B573_BIOGL|nr:transient-receptor-potential-like protein isoform X3 [Biomphalaria glabrata]
MAYWVIGLSAGTPRTRKKSFLLLSKSSGVSSGSIKCGHRMDPQERVFLDAVEKGDVPTVIRCLSSEPPVSVNCTDMLGRSAIQIAVDNENIELVELLLSQEGVKIGDALLYAIREGVYRIVEMLIDHPSISRNMLGTEWSRTRYVDDESFDYSPDISPVILAAHCNQFEILQLLLVHGASIDRPHELSCSCKRCQAKVHADSLRHSLLRINTYRALASPAWISLTSSDPVLTAFQLSWELDHLALRENEFKDSYLELGQQCKKYACDLLDQCRSSDEVIAVLNKTSEEDSEYEDQCDADDDKLTLSRLKLALKYEQKQFVSHPHCQQLLTSIWYAGLPGWRKRNGVMKFLTCFGLIVIMPFMSLYYLIFPRSKIGQLLRSPFMKFLYHSASFGVFLFLLVCASTDIMSNEPKRDRLRGPEPSDLEWLIVLWVTGFVWAECKQLWDEGLKAYIRQWWNWLDFIMLSLYLATFALRLVAYIQIESGKYGNRELLRKAWPDNDPTLISEGLFAVANVFSFARIIYLFQANQHLGPLQISLGCMLIDIAKFLFIFFLVVTSFACGLNQLYWYYKGTGENDEDMFFTLFSSYVTLFWSMFSMNSPSKLKLESGQSFTMTIGELMFMAYHAMAIIVLLNMLIAMMSSSFQEIENHADMEWKFARSKLWMGYFDEGSTLPSPFNLIVSPKSIYYLLVWIKDGVSECFCRQRAQYNTGRRKSSEGTIRRPTYNGMVSLPQLDQDHVDTPLDSTQQYQEVMRKLICRYIHQTKKQSRQDGVNEDDLLEIKQDISSLRFELREDRKLEMVRTTGHMDNLRRDLHHTISRLSPTAAPINGLSPNRGLFQTTHCGRTIFDPRGMTSSGVSQSPSLQKDGRSSNNTSQDGGAECAKSGVGLTLLDLDCLKAEILAGIKNELKETLAQLHSPAGCKTIAKTAVAQGQPPPSISPSQSGTSSPYGADLYHTHLYTQL